MALKTAQETSSWRIWGRKTLFNWDSYWRNYFLRSVIFLYNSLYTQAVAYTMYFELGEPVVYAGFRCNFQRNGGGHSSQVPSMGRTKNIFLQQYWEHCWKELIPIGDCHMWHCWCLKQVNAKFVPSIYFAVEIQLFKFSDYITYAGQKLPITKNFKGLMVSSLNSDHPFQGCCVSAQNTWLQQCISLLKCLKCH